MTNASKSYEITDFDGRGFTPGRAELIVETTLRIVVDGAELVRLQFSGMQPRFLTAGHLLACGLIESAQDIESLRMGEEADGALTAHAVLRRGPEGGPGRGYGNGRVSVTSGLGRQAVTDARPVQKPLPFAPGSIDPMDVIRLGVELRARSDLYRKTRGCHNSSLCLGAKMLLFFCDIGRHNAIDTLVGQCLLEGLAVEDAIIVTTGRVAREIVDKSRRAGVPALASTAAATSLAVEEAQKFGLTLIGALSETGFRVYNDPGRLAGWPGAGD
jgi:FdhD protein